jgi:hypothetical protein
MHRYPYLRNKDGKFTNPFDKGCSKNLREFLGTPAEARDRDVEFNDSVAVPLLELELQALLSGGRPVGGGGGATVVQLGGKDSEISQLDAKHDS